MEPNDVPRDTRTHPWRPRAIALGTMVTAGATSTVLYVLLGAIAAYEGQLVHEDLAGIAVWTIAPLVGLGVTLHVWARRPEHPLLLPLAAVAPLNAVGLLLNALPDVLPAVATDPQLAMPAVTGANLVNGLSAIAFVRIVATFPDGRYLRRSERVATRLAWLTLVPVVVLALFVPQVPFPEWLGLESLPNPWRAGFTLDQEVGVALQGIGFLVILPGALLLATRYRLLGPEERRRTRWVLLPVSLSVLALVAEQLLSTVIGQEPLGIAVAIVPAGLYAGLAAGLVGPPGAALDRAVRRSLVYAVLWLAVAAAYVGLSGAVGVVAGRRLPVEWAIGVTIVAGMVFQPARTWLERLVDRWMFGRRADPTRMVARLGDALAAGPDLATVLPQMSATLEEGLGLTWASVHIDDGGALGVGPAQLRGQAVLRVPIEHRGRVVGMVDCGPKRSGVFTDDDRAVVETLARQAALTVGNVQLTSELRRRAEELAESRSRLVTAQRLERRRIERDIHDGVQQDIVGLMAYVGSLQQVDGQVGKQGLAFVLQGLTRLLHDMRELAAGIHPSALTDLGLLASVEGLADRSPVPVTVRAEGALGAAELSDEVAAVAYFTIAEALTNVAKHASATEVEIVLERTTDTLRLAVTDDGLGFDPDGLVAGQGLSNMTERVAAVDGTLTVTRTTASGTVVVGSIPVGTIVTSGGA